MNYSVHDVGFIEHDFFQKRIFADLVGQLAGIIPGTITAISDAVKNGGKVRAFPSLFSLSATVEVSRIETLATLY